MVTGYIAVAIILLVIAAYYFSTQGAYVVPGPFEMIPPNYVMFGPKMLIGTVSGTGAAGLTNVVDTCDTGTGFVVFCQYTGQYNSGYSNCAPSPSAGDVATLSSGEAFTWAPNNYFCNQIYKQLWVPSTTTGYGTTTTIPGIPNYPLPAPIFTTQWLCQAFSLLLSPILRLFGVNLTC